MSQSVQLKTLLAENTMPSAPELVRPAADRAVQCLACGHRCTVKVGRAGVCRVRFNEDGVLRAPSGYASAVQIDPLEKKPFFHVLPGRDAFSFGMLGCDLHCSYCQNWITSQALRDDRAISRPHIASAEQLVESAVEHSAPAMVSTYNEPLITADWAVQVFKRAREHKLTCGFVSNGHATPEVLEYIRPYVDLLKIDLKSFSDKRYRELGGVLETVLDTIRRARQMGFWVEIVTLIVPGFNDTDEELVRMAEYLSSVSPEIPWHVTAFHPDYKMGDLKRTSAESLMRAFEIGRQAGLRFVYTGNAPGALKRREDTICPDCDTTLIRRTGFYVEDNVMVDGCCPSCRTRIPGVWEKHPPGRSKGLGMPQFVRL
ncbi:MAG: AmmeMemoRadiSam system radical SAM enzyme [bacterium]|nr:AmmeMemoRadiSam system radical SAM enzyme [bacterium]